jgi:hypothetical protein
MHWINIIALLGRSSATSSAQLTACLRYQARHLKKILLTQ